MVGTCCHLKYVDGFNIFAQDTLKVFEILFSVENFTGDFFLFYLFCTSIMFEKKMVEYDLVTLNIVIRGSFLILKFSLIKTPMVLNDVSNN